MLNGCNFNTSINNAKKRKRPELFFFLFKEEWKMLLDLLSKYLEAF